MTGLEQIIRQIEDDAAASAVSIRQKAEEEAAQIAQEARCLLYTSDAADEL